jgi:TRAP transporter TAXI family solute receptor
MVIRPGSVAMRDIADAIMYGYGLTENDVNVMEHSSSKEFVAAMKEGRVDAMGWPYTTAAPWVEELANLGKVQFVSDTPQGNQKMTEKYPVFASVTLPGGSYKGQDTDQLCTGLIQTLDINADVPADLVYAVTAALYDNFEQWSGYHANVKDFALPGAIAVERMVNPFHEGAIKYYKEKGLWTAEHEARQKALLEKVKALGAYKPLT